VAIGVLALQGDFAAHAAALRELGHEVVEVRRSAQLEGLAGLVIPGGESSALLILMRDEPWFDELRRFHERGGALLGTCAGAILLAREVIDPPQPSLELIDLAVRRNAFGRQVDSFEAGVTLAGDERPLRAAFIRAPRFERLGPGVEVLGWLGEEPVLVRQGQVLAATFHTELADDHRLHEIFVQSVFNNNATTHDEESRRTGTEGLSPGAVNPERRISC
jgi:5'-phosphate synthase pdxT subunit